jgi:preprotein translocase subunit YajC
MNAICLLAMGQTPAGTQSTAPPWAGLPMIILMFVVFYFLLIRPQSKRQKEMENMQKSLKPGMKVVTASGIVGTITSVNEKRIVLRSNDAKLDMTRGAVTEVLEKGDAEEEVAAPPAKK